MALLERSGPRAELDAAVQALDRGRGRLVLVHGEAGIGKTSLVREFLAGLGSGRRLLRGGCDDLLAPRPLGAVLELVDGMVDRTDLAAHPGRQLYAALRSEPTVCVVEDVHWADEATIDVLTYLARRVPELPLLLLLTFRDDEMPADHLLRRTLAAAPPSHCRRIGLVPLSLDAVRHLAAPGVDARAVHRVTGGNPFFVSEALTSGTERVPVSVRDAVLGRFGRLPLGARATAELVSVVPGRAGPSRGWSKDVWVGRPMSPRARDTGCSRPTVTGSGSGTSWRVGRLRSRCRVNVDASTIARCSVHSSPPRLPMPGSPTTPGALVTPPRWSGTGSARPTRLPLPARTGRPRICSGRC